MKAVVCTDRQPAREQKHNALKLDEPANVIVGQDFDKTDILLHKQQSGLTRFSEMHVLRSSSTQSYTGNNKTNFVLQLGK